MTPMTEREIRKQQKKQGILYPFPQERNKIVTFATPETDGIRRIRPSIRGWRAKKRYMPKEYQTKCSIRIFGVTPDPRKVAKVSLGKISRCFALGSYVNLAALKAEKLAPVDATYLYIKGKGKLKKRLLVEADEFTPRAIRMLVLTGGRPVQRG